MNGREECPMRHTNGNCLAIGGFCTSVNDEICNGLRNAYECGALREMRRNEWVSVNDRLPEQTPSLFSKFKDTDKWSKAMWVMDSETVLVTVVVKGESIVTTGKLQDGKWCTRISPVIECKVTHWMQMPEPPKEG